MYEPKSRSSKPTPAFSPVAAVPSSQRTEADSNERKDEADDENEDTKERMESDVVSNNVESDPKNTYLQVRENVIIISNKSLIDELLNNVRLGSGLPSGTLLTRPGITTTPRRECPPGPSPGSWRPSSSLTPSLTLKPPRRR